MSVRAPVSTGQKQAETTFKPGESGNPAGRPKGARNKLGEAFVSDLLSDWETHGAVTIRAAREKDPTSYLKVVASLMPRDVKLTTETRPNAEMSDDELLEIIRQADEKADEQSIDLRNGSTAGRA